MYKVKGTHTVQVDCTISKRQIYFILQEEYFKLLGDEKYYRKENEVCFIDHDNYFPKEEIIRTLTEEELQDCIALERTMDYFNRLVYREDDK